MKTYVHYVTVNEAAELLGLSPWTVRNLCWRGKLPAKRTRRKWLIPRKLIAEIKQQLPEDGVPNEAMVEYEKEHQEERAK